MSRRIKVSCLFLAAISTNYVLGADRSNDRFRGACTVEDLESGEVNTTYFDLDRHQSSRGSVAIASLDGWSYYVDLSFETINAGGGGSLVAMYVKNYKPWDQYNTFQKVEVINPVLDEDINIQGIYQTDKNIYQISTVKASCTGQVINVPSQVEDLINISLKTVLLDKDTEKLEVNIPYEGDKCKARIDFNFGNKSPYINLAKFTEDIDSVFRNRYRYLGPVRGLSRRCFRVFSLVDKHWSIRAVDTGHRQESG